MRLSQGDGEVLPEKDDGDGDGGDDIDNDGDDYGGDGEPRRWSCRNSCVCRCARLCSCQQLLGYNGRQE